MTNDFKEISAGILSPFVVQKIWGGSRLSGLKNIIHLPSDLPLGETWEVSCHPDGPSLLEGEALDELVDPIHLPYIVKFIDTGDNLSIQVHPEDEYALKHEQQSGKTECWIILDSDPSSGLFLGLKPDVTKASLRHGIENNDDISKLLNFYPVKKGDFFYVPAGSIHAIGEGITLAEIQQSSGVTYRVWDWNRVDKNGKGRTLHVDKAIDVINFSAEKNNKEYFKFKKSIISNAPSQLVEHDQFNVEILSASNEMIEIVNKGNRHYSLINLDQSLELQYKGMSIDLNPYSAFLIPIETSIKIINSNGPYLLVK
ncbi:MAG: class I mannose-6-phosphate isomerase [Bacteriovoracaceae bacterium]|jgi:mannose-6-phosphate isomerase|nr:class I mannose-6-phosphate isomerase [Bacteriovoracaceae bacterium]